MANVVVGTRWSPGNVQEHATKFVVHRKTIMDVVNGVSRVWV